VDTVSPTPVIVACAPNGAYRTRAEHPALPVTVAEVVADAVACRQSGAAMLHLHVRDDQGRHVLDARTYERAIAGLRAELGDDLVVQITTESGGRFAPPAQMAVVRRVHPEAVSLSVRELVRGEADMPAFGDFVRWLRAEGILTQFILYDLRDVRHLQRLRDGGAVEHPRPLVLFVLGSRTRPASGCDDLTARLALLDGAATWMTCAFGPAETAVAVASAALGGHTRVGFENNLHDPYSVVAASNAQRVRQVTTALSQVGYRPMSPRDARELLRSTL
jgi:uncharacterized protein (DUF849 family)